MRNRHLAQYLSTGGDGTGTSDFIGDYSSVPVTGLIQPAAGESYNITRMIVSLGDGKIVASNYGDIAALTDGLSLKVWTNVNTEWTDFMGGDPVKTSSEWGALCYDADNLSWGATPDDELLVVRYTFEKFGAPINLVGPNDRAEIIFSDDFEGLLHHKFLMEGMRST